MDKEKKVTELEYKHNRNKAIVKLLDKYDKKFLDSIFKHFDDLDEKTQGIGLARIEEHFKNEFKFNPHTREYTKFNPL